RLTGRGHRSPDNDHSIALLPVKCKAMKFYYTNGRCRGGAAPPARRPNRGRRRPVPATRPPAAVGTGELTVQMSTDHQDSAPAAPDAGAAQAYRYAAFICYRHAPQDRRWAI